MGKRLDELPLRSRGLLYKSMLATKIQTPRETISRQLPRDPPVQLEASERNKLLIMVQEKA